MKIPLKSASPMKEEEKVIIEEAVAAEQKLRESLKEVYGFPVYI